MAEWKVLPGDKAIINALKKEVKNRKIEGLTVTDYQEDKLSKALTFVKGNKLAIDAGANYGIMSYNMHPRFEQIHAFEVESNVRECLKENVKNFNLSKVVIHDCGLGDKEETVSLTYIKNSFGTCVDRSKGGEFLVKTVDSFNLPALDFFKIDCEGYEPYILEGAKQTIAKFKPVILMEDKNLSNKYYGVEGNRAVDLLMSWDYVKVVSWPKDCVMVHKSQL